MSTIVSLTSWKPRFPIIIDALNSILSGDIIPDRIVLVITKNELDYLPVEIKELEKNKKIEILESKDIGSHKKLIPVMIKYPDADIITIDDDWIYGSSFVSNLIEKHKQYPNVILCNWCLRIKLNEDGNLMPYNYWHKNIQDGYSDIDLFPMSGAGALWPAHCFDISKPDLNELYKCPNADDIYNKVLMIRNNINAKKIFCDCHPNPSHYDIISSTALANINVSNFKNNTYIHNFPEYLDLSKRISKLEIPKVNDNKYGFSTKIKEMKYTLSDNLHTICADKLKMKDFCANILGSTEYTVPTLGVYNNINDINKELSNVIVKCNHGSMMNKIFNDKISNNLSALNILDKFMNTDYSSKFGEMQYKNIERKLIVEPLLKNVKDIKVYTTSSEILTIQYNDFTSNKRFFYDAYGNYIKDLDLIGNAFTKSNKSEETKDIKDIYKKIIPLVKKIQPLFNFVRIDFLVSNNEIYIGELTFTPFAGNKKFCGDYDRIFGDKIFLPRENKWKTEALLLTKYLNKEDLDEWLQWHLIKKGIEHVHIFDNNNTFDIRPIVEKYGNRVSYEMIIGHPRQYDLYNRYISYQSKAEWIMPIDDDEYLDFDTNKFKDAYEMLMYYNNKIPNLEMLAIRWKHLFPEKIHSERNCPVLEYCKIDNPYLAGFFGSGNMGIKCFVKRDGIIHYEETWENKAGGHIPKHSKANFANLFNGDPITDTYVTKFTTIDDENVRLLHCRYKGYSDWIFKYMNSDKEKNCKTVCDKQIREKRFKFNHILETLE